MSLQIKYKTKTLFALCLLIFLPSIAQAQWSRESIDYAERNFLYFPGPQSLPRETQGYLATVWGGGMREVRISEDMKNDEFALRMPSFFKKDLKVFLRAQPRKAPLIVVIPGVFANADDGFAKAQMKWFSEMGYHVLTMPNCWSKDFAKARPIYKDEYPSGEANVVLEVTKWAIAQELGVDKVTSVQIFGESLGALTAAVVYSRDSRTPRPIFTAGATLTWPPIALYSAMSKLDTVMDETAEIYDAKCRHSIKRLKTKWRVLRGKYLTEPKPEEIECAKSVVAHYSFRQELKKLAETISKEEGIKKAVPADLTFEHFIHNFAPRYRAALDSSDQYGDLDYWLGSMSTNAASQLRILTSEDDFLNSRQSWSKPGLMVSPQRQMIMAHWGGHIGLSNTKAYEGLMRKQFELH